jgi:hypothetical protein
MIDSAVVNRNVTVLSNGKFVVSSPPSHSGKESAEDLAE